METFISSAHGAAIREGGGLVSDRGTPVYVFRPLEDPRWDEFLLRHPRASVFHSAAWIRALRKAYGYDAVAFTTSPSGSALGNAAMFCGVESWLTGRRLVSLPFSDHCDVLVDSAPDLVAITARLRSSLRGEKLQYIEIRPVHAPDMPVFGHCTTSVYYLHEIDLQPDLETIFQRFHKSSTQRKIRRAEREGLTYKEGCSSELLDHFFKLLIMTRRRHSIPPQPRKWFQSLIECFGDALKIRVAYQGCRPIAAILTLRYKDTLVYKNGCSDARFHNLGGIHMLFWRAIQEAKQDGLQVLDLGRSDQYNEGLVRFKDNWGARCTELTYFRMGSTKLGMIARGNWRRVAALQRTFRYLPDWALCLVGRIIYRHIG